MLVDPILTTLMIPTDAAAPVTRIVLNWRQRCRTISQPSVREGSVSRDAGGLMIMMQIVSSDRIEGVSWNKDSRILQLSGGWKLLES